MTTSAEFGAALTQARAEAGDPSYRKLERRAWEAFGDFAPTGETIRSYHNGKVSPEKADLVLVVFLATIYGKRAEDIHPVVGARLKSARDVLNTALGCTRQVAA